MSHERAKCLFPVASIPLILYSLEFLAKNKVKEVFIVSSREKSELKAYIDGLRNTHMIGKDTNFSIKYIRLQEATSLADALREVGTLPGLRDDFILMQGDIVCNASLEPALKSHWACKNNEFQMIMTKIFAEIPFANPVRDPSQDVALLVEPDSRVILDYFPFEDSDDSKSYKINRKHVSYKKSAEQRELINNVVDTEISICTKALLNHLNEDYEMKSIKEDFIIHINTSELTDDQI